MARPKKSKTETAAKANEAVSLMESKVIEAIPVLSLEKKENLTLYGKDEPYVKPVSIDPGLKLSQYKGSNEVNRAGVVNKQKHIRIP